jgi:hypothetical protein
MEARSDQVRWQIGQGWQTYLCKNHHKNVQGVIPPTQSFATTTTIVSRSHATSARLVEGIGQRVVPLEVSRLAVVAEETKGLNQAVTTPPSRRLALTAKLALQTTLLRYSVPQRHHR